MGKVSVHEVVAPLGNERQILGAARGVISMGFQMSIATGKDGVDERPEVPVRTLHVTHSGIGSNADLELSSWFERDGSLVPQKTQEVVAFVIYCLRIVLLELGHHLTHTDAAIHRLVRDGIAVVGKHEMLYLHAQEAGVSQALLSSVEVFDEPCAILRCVI